MLIRKAMSGETSRASGHDAVKVNRAG